MVNRPVPADPVVGGCSVDQAIADIGVLGHRVVTPDGHADDIRNQRIGFVRQLTQRPVMVKTCHRGELPGVEIRRIGCGNQRIGICRVSNYEHPNILRCIIVYRPALNREYLGVLCYEVVALHAFAAGLCTNEDGVVGLAKADGRVIGEYDVME